MDSTEKQPATQGAGTSAEYEVHPAANIFPMMPEGELQRLAHDIEVNGQREPIGLYDGKILDGRNRYAACKLKGIAPDFADLVEDDGEAAKFDPVAYVLSENLHRRHLRTSQRAMCAARLVTLGRGRPSKKVIVQNCTFTAEQAAEMFGCSVRSLWNAVEALRECTPKTVEKIERGELAASRAVAKKKQKQARGSEKRLAVRLHVPATVEPEVEAEVEPEHAAPVDTPVDADAPVECPECGLTELREDERGVCCAKCLAPIGEQIEPADVDDDADEGEVEPDDEPVDQGDAADPSDWLALAIAKLGDALELLDGRSPGAEKLVEEVLILLESNQ